MNNIWHDQNYWYPMWQWQGGYRNYRCPYYPASCGCNNFRYPNYQQFVHDGQSNWQVPYENDTSIQEVQQNNNDLINDGWRSYHDEFVDSEVASLESGIDTSGEGNDFDNQPSSDQSRETISDTKGITIDEAIIIAREKITGEVVRAELDTQNSVWVYKVDIVTSEDNRNEIEVDVNTGKIARGI